MSEATADADAGVRYVDYVHILPARLLGLI